jgi:hypothetical protein
MSEKTRIMYCNCKEEGKKGFLFKFREVEATKEGICTECGYYAVSKPVKYVNRVEDRLREGKNLRAYEKRFDWERDRYFCSCEKLVSLTYGSLWDS